MACSGRLRERRKWRALWTLIQSTCYLDSIFDVSDVENVPASGIGRTQAVRRADTERRLLDAALSLISDSGSRSMSTAQVGTTAGYSRGIVTHQFGSKKELLSRTVRHAQALIAVAPQANGLDWILELVDNYLAAAASGTAAMRAFVLMWGEAVANDVNLKDIYIERDSWFRARISAAVTDGIAQGVVRIGVDPSAFAYLLVGQLRGTAMQLMLAPNPAILGPLRAECSAMVRRHLTETAVGDL
jgi:AcrR family transcriptional regulator